jgi:monoamine oxidase
VALRFEKPFWPEEKHFIGDMNAINGGYAVYQNYYRYLDVPVLVGFSGGKSIRGREALTAEQTKDIAMKSLRGMFGKRIPEPVGVAVSRWHTDPFAVCCYPYVPVGSSSDSFQELAKPIGERLFFAGDATDGNHSGTVHGAYISGVREAKRIAKLAR